jgi:hypothetical protein
VRKSLVFITLVVCLVGYQMLPGRASSHREAPLIASDPQADNTDLYAFVSPDRPDMVTLIASYIPFENPQGGPNFYRFGDAVQYDINIDNNGDGVADTTFRFRFTTQIRNGNTFLYNTGPVNKLDDPNLNMYQTYTMQRIDNGVVSYTAGPMFTTPNNVGSASTPNYGSQASGIYQFTQSDGTVGSVFAGQSDDPFFLDLRVFDLLYGANLSEAGNDSLAGFNVHTIAIQVPKTTVRSKLQPIIGVWATASRPATTTRSAGSETGGGNMVQVSRLGNPLVNEVIIPIGSKDGWNGSPVTSDGQGFLKNYQVPEVPVLLNLLYGVAVPATPRNDLIQVFLTGLPGLNQPPGVVMSDELRLNTDITQPATPNRMAALAGDVAGYPNGRRLTDDVIDIIIQGAAGILTNPKAPALGDGVDRNDLAFRPNFPYVAYPHSGSRPWKLNPAAPLG